MNFKNIGQENANQKHEIEKRIDLGIKLYNEKNKENIPLVGEYGAYTRNLTYYFGEDGIDFSWEKEYGRSCGGYQDYEDKGQLIPYEYFEEEVSEEKINEDFKRRKNIKNKIKELEKENEVATKEEKEHRKHLFNAKDIQRLYGYINFTDIEKEVKKCEALILINSEKIKKLNGELK